MHDGVKHDGLRGRWAAAFLLASIVAMVAALTVPRAAFPDTVTSKCVSIICDPVLVRHSRAGTRHAAEVAGLAAGGILAAAAVTVWFVSRRNGSGRTDKASKRHP
jgi:hypothetical protein